MEFQKLNITDKKYLIEYIENIIGLSSDIYISEPIINIIFSYGIRKGLAESKSIVIKANFQKYYNKKLPISFNPLDYGKLLRKNDNIYFININKKTTVIIDVIDNGKEKYNLVEYYQNGVLIYKWKDTYINDNSFKREIGKSIYTYENNELKLFRVIKSSKPIKSIKTQKNLNEKIITMDLETRNLNSQYVSYLISWYDGINNYSYFITDYNNNVDLMIRNAILDLYNRKYDNYKVYLHNLANFDGIFLLKILSKIGYCESIIHKGKLISIQFNCNNNVFHFKDSYQLLPSSLRNLCHSFNVERN